MIKFIFFFCKAYFIFDHQVQELLQEQCVYHKNALKNVLNSRCFGSFTPNAYN